MFSDEYPHTFSMNLRKRSLLKEISLPIETMRECGNHDEFPKIRLLTASSMSYNHPIYQTTGAFLCKRNRKRQQANYFRQCSIRCSIKKANSVEIQLIVSYQLCI